MSGTPTPSSSPLENSMSTNMPTGAPSLPTGAPSLPTGAPSLPTGAPSVQDVSGKLNLYKKASVDPMDQKIEGSSPLNLNADPNYLTNFCKNRNTPTKPLFKNPFDIFKKGFKPDLIGYAIVGGCLFLYLIWAFFKYYDVALPFAGGVFNIIKFLIIYTIIILVLKLFFKFVFSFKFWMTLFVKYFRLFLNPLLNPKVSSAYCFFTSYVNWLIYYPAKIYYFICVLAICGIFILCVLPVIACISFVIGYLFSLLGDGRSFEGAVDGMKKAVGSVKLNTVKTSDLATQAKEVASQAPGALSQASALMKAAPDLMKAAPEMMKSLPGLMKSAPEMMKAATEGLKDAPGFMDTFKYKMLDAK
jgi:hypothetical protein